MSQRLAMIMTRYDFSLEPWCRETAIPMPEMDRPAAEWTALRPALYFQCGGQVFCTAGSAFIRSIQALSFGG